MPQAVNTLETPVFRPDGTQVFGIDAELELKMQASRDTGFEQALLGWVVDVIRAGGKAKKDKELEKFSFKDPEDIFESLKNGVALCNMMNAIEPGSIKKVDTRDIGIVHMANIDMYLKACWKLGLSSGQLFLASDLFRGKSLQAVIQNLYAVAKLATEKKEWSRRKMPPLPDKVLGGGQLPADGKKKTITLPTKEDEEKRIAASKPAKKWAPVQTAPDFGQAEDLSAVCGSCQAPLPQGAKFCKSCGSKVILQDNAAAIDALKAEHAAEIKKLEADLTDVRSRLADAEKANEERRTSSEDTEHSLEAARAAQKKSEREIAKLKSQNSDLQAKYDAAMKRSQAAAKPSAAESDGAKLAAMEKAHAQEMQKIEQAHARELKSLEDSLAEEKTGARDLQRKLREANSTIKKLRSAAKDAEEKLAVERKAREEWADRYKASVAYRRKTSRLTVMRQSMDDGPAPTEPVASPAAETKATPEPQAEVVSDDIDDDFVVVLSDSDKATLSKLLAALVDGTFKAVDSSHRGWMDEVMKMQKTEMGRREFATQLRAELKRAQTSTVSELAFDLLLGLVNRALTEIDAASNKELFTARKLMRIATGVYHEIAAKPGAKATQVFMFEKPETCAHNVWRDLDFWEFMFNDELFRKYSKYFPDEDTVDPDFLTSLVCTYVLQMTSQWDLSTDFVQEFVHATLHSSTFRLSDPAAIETRLEPFVRTGGKDHGRDASTAEKGSDALQVPAAGGAKPRPRKNGGSKNEGSSSPAGSFIKNTFRGLKKKGEKLEMPPGDILRQGQMAKKGHARKNWKLRWFILKPGHLVYMEKATPNPNSAPDIVGIVRLKRCFAAPSPSDARPFAIVISSGADNVEYLLDADNVSNMHSWLDAIRGAIEEPLDAVQRGAAAAQLENKAAGNLSLTGAAAAAVSGLGVVNRADPRKEEATAKADAKDAAAAVAPRSQTVSKVNVVCNAVATADFVAEAKTELALKKGDQVSVLKKDDSGWWLGICGDKKGWFASEYVKEQPASLP